MIKWFCGFDWEIKFNMKYYLGKCVSKPLDTLNLTFAERSFTNYAFLRFLLCFLSLLIEIILFFLRETLIKME